MSLEIRMARGLREHCFSSPRPLSTPATVLQLPCPSPPQCKSQDYLAPKFCPPQILQPVSPACAMWAAVKGRACQGRTAMWFTAAEGTGGRLLNEVERKGAQWSVSLNQWRNLKSILHRGFYGCYRAPLTYYWHRHQRMVLYKEKRKLGSNWGLATKPT